MKCVPRLSTERSETPAHDPQNKWSVDLSYPRMGQKLLFFVPNCCVNILCDSPPRFISVKPVWTGPKSTFYCPPALKPSKMSDLQKCGHSVSIKCVPDSLTRVITGGFQSIFLCILFGLPCGWPQALTCSLLHISFSGLACSLSLSPRHLFSR